ncbi:fatty acid desaturase [Paraburkholderia sp. BCC1876]|uniref:fatty acid desaturase family protein n=1 Tax=Paraburkholderia sp. BCC1876 TaxID=2676303 RepID=UPI001590CFB1|nr:fatty acid desaturase [Paraburkholderia sp. BCC1876]
MKTNAALTDIAVVRKELLDRAADRTMVCSIKLWRPVFDLTLDWGVIMLASLGAYHLGLPFYLLALGIVGNRQRALGNLLHEAGHRNLYRSRVLNDSLAATFLAPALAANLHLYRVSHSQHHTMLGVPGQDPDYIAPDSAARGAWLGVYVRQLFARANWLGSVLGQMTDRRLAWHGYVRIGVWWMALLAVLTLLEGPSFAIFFTILWLAAKATVFHAITTFREMCDHFGLQPGGIYSFTRDAVIGRCWHWVIHPHNNGYHLSHHMMPSVPYYKLPSAQKMLAGLPSYAEKAVVCDSYFFGNKAVVRDGSRLSRFN